MNPTIRTPEFADQQEKSIIVSGTEVLEPAGLLIHTKDSRRHKFRRAPLFIHHGQFNEKETDGPGKITRLAYCGQSEEMERHQGDVADPVLDARHHRYR